MFLAVFDGEVDQLGVLGLLGGSEDEGGVGGGVLRLVLVDGGEVAGVADDGLAVPSVSDCSSPGDVASGRSRVLRVVVGEGEAYRARLLQLLKRGYHDD